MTKVINWAKGLGFAGSAIAWIIALLSGFSSSHVVCFNSARSEGCLSSGSPYWLASTVLWLAPLLAIMLAATFIVQGVMIDKKIPNFIITSVQLVLLIAIVLFVSKMAAGNRL